jgi:hypothetical protein
MKEEIAMTFALMSSKRFKAHNLHFIQSFHSTIKGVLNTNELPATQIVRITSFLRLKRIEENNHRLGSYLSEAEEVKTAVCELIKQSLEKRVNRLAQKFRVLDSKESLLALYSNKYKKYEFSTKLLAHCFNILDENRFESNHLSSIIEVSKKILD